jgi:hypothetical protein
MITVFKDQAFARGFRDGLRSIVTGRCEMPHRVPRREVGSPATDRVARFRDMEMFGADVRRGQRHGAHE